ncbi:hypothetical protein HMPREF0373_00595 [Eubacterium ramulus ATCC 29099]|uniref:Uncharacterized protein n=1 Tax=Eubacterium ramulus ATCC 29099 TaxID=1256908 RepID=U2PJE4_EUBRA|nr:hypothetical protein HMPREF0373_00595 [Eubacterium ramulus ATCC 29099]
MNRKLFLLSKLYQNPPIFFKHQLIFHCFILRYLKHFCRIASG